MRLLKPLIFLAVLGAALFALYGYSFLNPPGHDPGRQVLVDVPPGTSYRQLAATLEEKGVVSSAQRFLLVVKLLGRSQALKVGEYQLEHRQPLLEILSVVTSGKSVPHRVTIPEGYNIYEIASLLESLGLGTRQEVLALLKNSEWATELLGEPVETLEGYLFPETYTYSKYTPLRSLIQEMTRQFLQNYEQIGRHQTSPLSRHQLVTLASIIEKETAVSEERFRIASVFFNRLQKNMRLQTDPTILYGILDKGEPLPDRIRYKHLRESTRYNTYTFSGLPPGPIANPGRASLEAAFEPDGSEYLYFVSRNDGSHYFSKTYKEHNEAVQKYQVRGETD